MRGDLEAETDEVGGVGDVGGFEERIESGPLSADLLLGFGIGEGGASHPEQALKSGGEFDGVDGGVAVGGGGEIQIFANGLANRGDGADAAEKSGELRILCGVDVEIFREILGAGDGVNRSGGNGGSARGHLRIEAGSCGAKNFSDCGAVGDGDFTWMRERETDEAGILAGNFVDFRAANFYAASAIAQSIALDFGFIEAALREGHDGCGGSFRPECGSGAVEISRVVEATFVDELGVSRILGGVGGESGKFVGKGCFAEGGEISKGDGVSAGGQLIN